MHTPVIKVEDLSKCFTRRASIQQVVLHPLSPKTRINALHKINFTLGPGEILAVAGPNGAGKTTLLKILADLLTQDTGRIKFKTNQNGQNTNHTRSRIGYVASDERSFFWRLSGKQNLEFFGSLYGLTALNLQKRIPEMLKLFDIHEYAQQLYRDYSSGTRKKFAVIRALLHQPDLLLLDEVTNNLDLNSAELVKSLITKYINNGKGRAAIWCTHRLEEISQVCQRVLLMDKGKVIFLGNTGRFQSWYTIQKKDQSKNLDPATG